MTHNVKEKTWTSDAVNKIQAHKVVELSWWLFMTSSLVVCRGLPLSVGVAGISCFLFIATWGSIRGIFKALENNRAILLNLKTDI